MSSTSSAWRSTKRRRKSLTSRRDLVRWGRARAASALSSRRGGGGGGGGRDGAPPARVGEGAGGFGALLEAGADVGEVVAQCRHARAGDVVADEVGDQQPDQQLGLQRRERDRRRRPLAQCVAALVGERVHRARARAARL